MGFCVDPNNVLNPPMVERFFVLDEALATELAEISALMGENARDLLHDLLVLSIDEIRAELEAARGGAE